MLAPVTTGQKTMLAFGTPMSSPNDCAFLDQSLIVTKGHAWSVDFASDATLIEKEFKAWNSWSVFCLVTATISAEWLWNCKCKDGTQFELDLTERVTVSVINHLLDLQSHFALAAQQKDMFQRLLHKLQGKGTKPPIVSIDSRPFATFWLWRDESFFFGP